MIEYIIWCLLDISWLNDFEIYEYNVIMLTCLYNHKIRNLN